MANFHNEVEWEHIRSLIDYQDGLLLMENQLLRVINYQAPDTIFLLEHNPVYTAGTSHSKNELLNDGKFPVIYTGRGGKFTYHGPGQRIIYPIIDLRNNKDIKLYVQTLEQWMITTLAKFKITAFTMPGRVGIWVLKNGNPAKIGAIGIRIRKWVTSHGIAVNINTNLDHYDGIVPCGIDDLKITSFKDLGINIVMEEFDAALI